MIKNHEQAAPFKGEDEQMDSKEADLKKLMEEMEVSGKELFSKAAEASCALGTIRMGYGDTDRAVIAYEKALELDPNNRKAKKMLASFQRTRGN